MTWPLALGPGMSALCLFPYKGERDGRAEEISSFCDPPEKSGGRVLGGPPRGGNYTAVGHQKDEVTWRDVG